MKQQIEDDVREAMRARDSLRLGVLRMLTAAIRQGEIDERAPADDARVRTVLGRLLRQHQESIAQFERAGRHDLAEREVAERDILSAYLPPPLSEAEVDALIEEALRDTGASSMRDMGPVMTWLKDRTEGRADMGAISAAVRARLGR